MAQSGYSPSPRPTFDGPAAIPYAGVTRHLWGDEASGLVADWIYVSSGMIHQLVFALPAGGSFRHSDAFRTIFAADVVYVVLSGTLLLANPETGEVQRALPGEACFFRRDTWHHAWAGDGEPLRVLEFFAPPPATGTSGRYAQTKPNLADPRYGRDDLLGAWPMAKEAARREASIHVVREHDLLWRLEGCETPTPVALMVATEHLTAGRIGLVAGQRSDWQTHGGDEGVYVRTGVVHLRTGGEGAPRWFELGPGDGAFVPKGVPHQYHNLGGVAAELYFGVAPSYLAGEG
jgi:quercetin dioxygenase-like cupin family protein